MENKKYALVLGGNGFIGHTMARRLKSEGYWVRVVDIEEYKYGENDYADEVIIGDLRDKKIVQKNIFGPNQRSLDDIDNAFCEVYSFCCLMGGAGFCFSGLNDADIMHDSALMNLNICDALVKMKYKGKVFYSSSACMYPQEIQESTDNKGLRESDAYPANPDSEYGWEKTFSERLYSAFYRNHGLDIRIARFHNIYGPEGTYKGGKEKAPAATCRKVIESKGEVEVWGDGEQTRSFLYIDDCVDAVRLLMSSDFREPINIGSEEMVSINELTKMVIEISTKENLQIKYIEGPQGVRGRNSNNDLARKVLGGWKPKYSLRQGMHKTYDWIEKQILPCRYSVRFDLANGNSHMIPMIEDYNYDTLYKMSASFLGQFISESSVYDRLINKKIDINFHLKF
jgi:nucleoside-diphosphate-sugar epimerase